MAKETTSKGEKEVALKGHSKVREESFGTSPPVIAIQGGIMPTFGYKPNDAVWPTATDPVSPKTGYPEGWQESKKPIVVGKEPHRKR
jgi:hypothetical protein